MQNYNQENHSLNLGDSGLDNGLRYDQKVKKI